MDTESVTIKRNILLRSIVTEQLRNELAEQLQSRADEINERIAQIDEQTKGYLQSVQRSDLQQAMALRKRIEAEKKQYQEQADTLLEQKAQIEELSDGTEIARGSIESFVEVSVGDDISEALAGIEIVTKNHKIVDIRKRQTLDEPQESVAEVLQGPKSEGGIEVPGQT